MSEIVTFVRAVLDQAAQQDAAEAARYSEIEAEGFRIVDGGQTGPYDDDSKCHWEITDFRTGKALARGYGPAEDFDREWDALGDRLGQKLYHRDLLDEEVMEDGEYLLLPESNLPVSLAEALRDWADDHAGDAHAWVATHA